MGYDWKRRWFPLYEGGSGSAGATARAREAQALWQLRVTTDAVLFDEIRHVPCLILLGEPGIGKTYALQHEQRHIDSRISNDADKTLLVDLVTCNSIEDIRTQLFKHETYRDWKASNHRLTMFVDSLDQVGISVDEVIRLIGNELNAVDVRRLHLRLACRDHEWSLTLEDILRHVWRSRKEAPAIVRVYQLAPLAPEDIRYAGQDNNLDPDVFVQRIEDADAWALATVPITLNMLLKTPEYLTNSRAELYEHALRELLKGPGATPYLTNVELLDHFKTASRIATVMMLSKTKVVNIDATGVLGAPSKLVISDLLSEVTTGSDERLIRDVLSSALFHGAQERRWAHQSFNEFLAARFLSNKNIPLNKILEMTLAPDGKFASHLHDTLRWLIEMRSDVLPEVIQRQPMLVLRADLSHLSEDEVRTIYEGVLSLDDPYIYSHEAWNLSKFQASHPCAKDILLPYLTDTKRSPYLRLFVLRLMEHLGIREIDDALVRLALDKNEEQVLRRLAARRICDAGSDESKLQLKPYIYGRNDDPEDELKGYALQALWPDHLTAGELFAAISPPKRENLWGSYKTFLFDDSIADKLQVVDLPTALKWVAAQPPQYEMSFSLRDLPGKIMRKAWENIQVPGVMEAFAETAAAMMTRFDDGLFGQAPHSYPPDKALDNFESGFAANTEHRRELALRCLPHLLDEQGREFQLIDCWPPIVVADDLEWLLGLLDSETDVVRQKQLVQLIAGIFPGLGSQGATLSERYKDIEKVYEASERHPALEERMQRFFVSVLKDPIVVSNRERHRKLKEIEENQKRELAKIRPIERLEEALGRIEKGDTLQWLGVISALSHSPDGRGEPWNFKPDLMDFPLWHSCDTETQERIVEAARTYLIRQDAVSTADSSEDWYDTGRIPYVELHGYLAIFLLFKADTNALHQLPADRWKRWAKIIVWYPDNILLDVGRTDYRREIRELQQDLLRRLHENDPRAFTDTLRTLLLSEDQRNSYIGQTLRKVEHLRDSGLEPILLSLLQDATLSPKGQRSILDFLLAKPNAEAQRIAEARISSGSTNQNEKALLAEFAVSLLTNAREFDRSMVWELFHSDDAVGRSIVEKIAEEDRHTARIATKLSAPELVDLFIWLEERYPTSEDPKFDGAHTVTTREQIGHWRNGIIQELRTKDSWEALHGIRLILFHYPHLEWLQSAWLGLEKTVEGSGWNPPSPKDIVSWLSSYQYPRLSKADT